MWSMNNTKSIFFSTLLSLSLSLYACSLISISITPKKPAAQLFPDSNSMGSTSTEGTTDRVVLIEVESEEWAETLSQKVESATARQKKGRVAGQCTIFRVPTVFGRAHSDDYQPKIISFGPYHCNNPELKAINQHKLRYLQKILDRNDNAKLEVYLNVIRGLEARARSSYSEEIEMGSREFVEMMLLDACFIIELLLMQPDRNMAQTTEMEEDPIRSSKWILLQIRYDMLVFENQIPFFILQSVFDLATRSAAPNQNDDDTESLIIRIIRFMGGFIPCGRIHAPPGWKSSPPQLHHILHLFHSYILHSSTLVMHRSDESNTPLLEIYDDIRFPCATKLKDAGVVFKGKAANSFLDVTFRNEIMEIPTLDIYNHTPSLFRNLIAFEVCFGKCGMYITAYAEFMDSLIDTADDVALLHKTKCILNGLGSDDAPAALFNELGDIVYEGLEKSFYLGALYKNLNKHYNSRRNQWRATLMRDYFSSPWAIISLVGALIVIFLTIIQTVYALIAYYNPHN